MRTKGRLLGRACFIVLLPLAACSTVATVEYEQVGACTDLANHPVGRNTAVVIFRMIRVKNLNDVKDFRFQTSRLYYPTASGPARYDPFATFAYDQQCSLPRPDGENLVKSGTRLDFDPFTYFAITVRTQDPDGAREASQTAYFLSYDAASGDPSILVENGIPKQTHWQYTPNCAQVQLCNP